MAGPDHDDARPFKRPGRNLSGFGRDQALEANSQWKTYNHLVGGQTLFADVERCIDLPGKEPGDPRIPCTVENDTAGWARCDAFHPNGCKDNQAVLEGFLRRVATLGFTPGVYTGAERWKEFFGENYVPTDGLRKPIPFVLWLTGFDTWKFPARRRTPEEVEEDFPAAEAAGLGGMRTVIWQHYINGPDWDVMRQNPSKGFVPQPAPDTNPHPEARLTPIAAIQLNEGNPSTGAFGPEYRFTVDYQENINWPQASLVGFVWELEHKKDLTPGREYLHVVVKRISGPAVPTHIEGDECTCDCELEAYSPCYWQNDGPGGSDIGNGETIDIGGVAPLLSFDPQLDGARFVIHVFQAPYSPYDDVPGVYEFEIQEIYSVDVNSGQKTVLWRKP
jgi:hypothetical protein